MLCLHILLRFCKIRPIWFWRQTEAVWRVIKLCRWPPRIAIGLPDIWSPVLSKFWFHVFTSNEAEFANFVCECFDCSRKRNSHFVSQTARVKHLSIHIEDWGEARFTSRVVPTGNLNEGNINPTTTLATPLSGWGHRWHSISLVHTESPVENWTLHDRFKWEIFRHRQLKIPQMSVCFYPMCLLACKNWG